MHVLEKFQYCPVCGSKHFVEQTEKSKRCESCGFEYFLNPSSAVAAFILNEKGELLVTQRRYDPGRGLLTFLVAFVTLVRPSWRRYDVK